MMTLTATTQRKFSLLDDLLARICRVLQITPTQRALAESHYLSVGEWLGANESPLSQYAPQIFPQGSLRIGTTVKPKGRNEYDLDLVLQLLMHFRDPLVVLDDVERRLRGHGTYRPMVERMNRCIRLNFAGDFHLDILPARRDYSLPGSCLLVPDCELHDWKPSNPKGYAAWFESRSALRRMLLEAAIEPLPAHERAEEKTPLQLAVQLFKRWRDVRYAAAPSDAPISIVLTTVAGMHYQGEETALDTLSNVVTKVLDSLPRTGRLYVLNPMNSLEDLSERWDRNLHAYQAFVLGLRELERDLESLRMAKGVGDSTEILQRLFGELVPTLITEQARDIEEARRANRLGVSTSGLGALATSAGSGVIPIPRNTFYGS